MDEISITSATNIAELKDGKVTSYKIGPEQFGLKKSDASELGVKDAEQSLAIVKGVLGNKAGPARDIVQLNAGAAIYVAGLAPTLEEGIKKAGEVIASGEALKRLESLVTLSQSLAG